jgi:DNA-binding beta-propeller fold protein YncE
VKFSHQEDVMKTLLLSASVFSALTVIAVAAEPKMIWEASGFKSPESAAYDRAAGAIYISNLNGGAMEKDGNGFISKLGPDGKVIALEWVKGLDSPTGLALANNRLYAADVDKIVEIDVGKGEIVGRYEAPGAKFLNDLAADKEGRVYASDMVAKRSTTRTVSLWRRGGSWSPPGARWPRTSRPKCQAI